MDEEIRGLEEEKRRMLEEEIRHARWEARMVKKYGRKWFEWRDSWLWRALEADMQMWRDPRVREALIRALLARERR